jgi:hypothetical protein
LSLSQWPQVGRLSSQRTLRRRHVEHPFLDRGPERPSAMLCRLIIPEREDMFPRFSDERTDNGLWIVKVPVVGFLEADKTTRECLGYYCKCGGGEGRCGGPLKATKSHYSSHRYSVLTPSYRGVVTNGLHVYYSRTLVGIHLLSTCTSNTRLYRTREGLSSIQHWLFSICNISRYPLYVLLISNISCYLLLLCAICCICTSFSLSLSPPHSQFRDAE